MMMMSSIWQEMKSDPLWMGWNISGSISVLLPLLILTIARITGGGNYNEDGQENDNQNNDDNNNNNNNNNHWWNRWFGNNNNNYYNENGEQEQRSNDVTPWWWFWSSSEEDRRPEDEGRGALVFVYIWSFLLFGSILLYGNFVFRKQTVEMNNNVSSLSLSSSSSSSSSLASLVGILQGALFVFTNLSLLVLCLITNLGDAIQMEGREIEENGGGWYGQFGVCIFFTTLFWLIFGCIYTYLLYRKYQGRKEKDNSEEEGGYFRQISDWLKQPNTDNGKGTTTKAEAQGTMA